MLQLFGSRLWENVEGHCGLPIELYIKVWPFYQKVYQKSKVVIMYNGLPGPGLSTPLKNVLSHYVAETLVT